MSRKLPRQAPLREANQLALLLLVRAPQVRIADLGDLRDWFRAGKVRGQ